MNWSSLLPDPVHIFKGTTNALFEKRKDQPFIQGVARNAGHAAFGDTIGDEVDSKLLGDYPGGYRHPQMTDPNSGVLGGGTGIPMSAPPSLQPSPQQSAQAAFATPGAQKIDLAALLQNLIKQKATS